MPRILGALIAAGVLPFAACSSVSVSSDYDPKADFGSFKTWDWFPGTPAGADDLTHRRIQGAVEAALPMRGLKKSAEKPDLQVAARVSVKQKIEVYPTTVSVGYGWRYGYAGVHGSDVRAYDEGTLVIDLVRPATKELVWRGVARGAVDPSLTPEEREAKVQDVVRRILEGYPPR